MNELANEKNSIGVYIEDEMKSAYMDYAMSVIIGRALPDVRDGLKPVHRRILYAMFREGLLHDKKYSKCAGVVGEVLKKYHPHGDTAVYDSLVRMAQEWNLRYPLIDGQGNFGSVDGDPAAAYRYTEARMEHLAEEILTDIDKETVPFAPNFDGSTLEPKVLPTKVPNLLINGSAGIAVGMATNIPPHNLIEIVNGLIALIDNPSIEIAELMQFIKGPDFPTAGFIHGREGIRNAFFEGRGLVQMRARTEIEELKNDKEAIIVTELPYQVNKAKLVEKIAFLIKTKKLDGITDLRDESDRNGMRVVIELRRGEMSSVVLNKLYKQTQMQDTFGVIMLAIVNNQPKVLNLKELLGYFIQHRIEIVTNRTIFDLKKAQEKAHILEGLKIALDHIDEVIKLIRASKSAKEAQEEMKTRFSLDDIQSKAILEMRLQRLTGMEQEKVITDLEELRGKIKKYNFILSSEEEKFRIIKAELLETKEKYGDERRTEIIDRQGDINIEDLIADEDVVVTISHSGYIKRNQLSNYKSQHRGGKGVIGMGTKEEDVVSEVFIASTHSYILFFSSIGKVYWLKVHEIPDAGRISKGRAIINLVQLEKDETVTTYISVKQFEEGKFLMMLTEKGTIKKTPITAYSHPRVGGIKAINLDEGDKLISVRLTDGNSNLIIATNNGFSICINENNVRTIGRVGRGVRGIRLRKNDKVANMIIAEETSTVLTVTENGYGKRTNTSEYRVQNRGGVGIINIKIKEKNGTVVEIKAVNDDDELIIVTQGGQIIRLRISDISTIGRNTQGVKLINLTKKDKVVSIATSAISYEDPINDEETTEELPDDIANTEH